jgi:hypothetical protein
MSGIVRAASRRLRRWGAAAVVAVAAVGAVVTSTAAPAFAANGLSPTSNCAWDNGDGTFTAVFGYTNTSRKTYSIPLGANNQVYAGYSTSDYWVPVDANPPTSFPPGSVASAVTVSFPAGGGAAWSIDGVYTTVTGSTTACPSSTLATTTDGTTTVLGVVIALGASVVLGRRRGRHGPQNAR